MGIQINELIIRANIVQNQSSQTSKEQEYQDNHKGKTPKWTVLKKQKERERER